MIDIALIGLGKIAKDQHIPAIHSSKKWNLAATVSKNSTLECVRNFHNFDDFLDNQAATRVVSLCMPPQFRFEYAMKAIETKRHVMLEKPPGATISECHALQSSARQNGVSIFATWHSREAPMVPAAKAWLRGKKVRSIFIEWKEDVNYWHPGQDWIWDAGGLGVFDPGINALSILTEIIAEPLHLVASNLSIPSNKKNPIAAILQFRHPNNATVTAEFDWRQTGDQIWSITVKTDEGRLELCDGGTMLRIDGQAIQGGNEFLEGEYPRLYHKFAKLIETGGIDMDLAPLIHVADAFMIGTRKLVDPV